jgi:hypothetical protein
MHTSTLLGPETFRSMPWRNGLGTTVELLKQDLSGETGFAWRLSMADVTTDGEFSNFSGYDRTLLLLEGNGLTLDCGGARHRLEQPLQAARFRGEDATVATLHDGPVKDFNVMTSRQHCNARVSAHAKPAATSIEVSANLLLIYTVTGDLRIDSSGYANLRIPPQHLLVVQDPVEESLSCRGASFIAIQISHIAQ